MRIVVWGDCVFDATARFTMDAQLRKVSAPIVGEGPLRLVALRWLLLFFFLPGLVPSWFSIDDATEHLAPTFAIAAAACALLLWRLRSVDAKTMWCWPILMAFLFGYYEKFFVFVSSRSSLSLPYDPLTGELDWVSSSHLDDAIRWATAGFVSFCLSSVGLLLLDEHGAEPPATAASGVEVPARRETLLLLLTVLTGLGALIPPILFGFGQMGTEQHQLPFRLDAVVTRYRTMFVPAVMLLVVWRADMSRHRVVVSGAILGLIVLSLFDGVVRTSRGSLLYLLVPVLLLWLMTKRLTTSRLGLAIVALVATLVMYPFFTQLRIMRITEGTFYASQMTDALSSLSDSQARLSSMQDLGTRASGLEGLVHILRHESGRSDLNLHLTGDDVLLLLDNNSMVRRMTYDIVGVGYAYVEGRPPGLVGAFALTLGRYGMLAGIAIFTLLSWLGWRVLRRMDRAPVYLAIYAWVLFQYASEGVLGIQDPLAMAVAVPAIALVDRFLVGKRT